MNFKIGNKESLKIALFQIRKLFFLVNRERSELRTLTKKMLLFPVRLCAHLFLSSFEGSCETFTMVSAIPFSCINVVFSLEKARKYEKLGRS